MDKHDNVSLFEKEDMSEELIEQSDNNFGNLMIVKFDLIYRELLNNKNVVYLDGDIVVKKNITEYLYNFSDEYICIAEYYSPTPVKISYRGYYNRLFKRDFAGELMSKYPDLELVDYGFLYHKDPIFPQDDITW